MSEPSTYIKLDRNILSWGWYTDVKTKAVFIHIILKANVKESEFLGVTVKRGQLVTSYPSLARQLNLSIKSVRTALNHLKATGEVAVKIYPKFSLISVVNYDRYQDRPADKTAGKGQASGSQGAGKGQQSKNIKNVKNGKNIEGSPPAKEYKPKKWEKEHLPPSLWNRFDSEEEWREWDAR